MDTVELDTAHQTIRPDKEHEAMRRLQDIYGKRFDSQMLAQSRRDIAVFPEEPSQTESIRQYHEQKKLGKRSTLHR